MSSPTPVSSQGHPVVEHSEAEREPVCIGLQVEGKGGLYAAQSVDLTGTGALVWITDEGFASSEEAENLVAFGERVAVEFEDRMRIRLSGSGVFHEAEVAAVDYVGEDEGPVLLACHFVPGLNGEECKRHGLERDGSLVVNRAEFLAQTTRTKLPARSKVASPSKLGRIRPVSGRPDTTGVPDGQSERRRAPRTERILYAEVSGEFGAFKAYVLNLSFSGALLTINDAAFAPPKEPEKLVLFTKRMGLHFGNGMVLRLLEADISVKADVVRVAEKSEGGTLLVLVGCKFRRDLTEEECAGLELEPPRPDAPDAGPPGEDAADRRSPIQELLAAAAERRATDLHIKAGSPPRIRVAGTLEAMGTEAVSSEEAHSMAVELMTSEQAARFERDGDVDLALGLEGVGRFRINVLRQRGATGIVARCIPGEVPGIDSLGLSVQAKDLAERARGLLLVTGPAGSGKSTTVAALVDHINRTRPCHILTVESPIEYLHSDVQAHVTQREVGQDAPGFHAALRRAMRQDPDVIVVGELRDRETIGLALAEAEAGVLVIGTLPTPSAASTPHRVVDVFPAADQAQIRHQLADTLQGVLSQVLVPRVDGGMAVAQEALLATDGVRALIREGRTLEIAAQARAGTLEGVHPLEASLNELVSEGAISRETAAARAGSPGLIRQSESQGVAE